MIVCPPIVLSMALLETKDGSIVATAERYGQREWETVYVFNVWPKGQGKGLW